MTAVVCGLHINVTTVVFTSACLAHGLNAQWLIPFSFSSFKFCQKRFMLTRHVLLARGEDMTSLLKQIDNMVDNATTVSGISVKKPQTLL